ncbi:MAG: hypothetical protein ACYC0H_13120 [Solirubrobacteraceae bacterium]
MTTSDHPRHPPIVRGWFVENALGGVRVQEVEEHRGWSFVVAAIELIARIAIVSSPHIGFATLALLTGIAFIANGLGLFAFGWQMQELEHEQPPGTTRSRQRKPQPVLARAGRSTGASCR